MTALPRYSSAGPSYQFHTQTSISSSPAAFCWLVLLLSLIILHSPQPARASFSRLLYVCKGAPPNSVEHKALSKSIDKHALHNIANMRVSHRSSHEEGGSEAREVVHVSLVILPRQQSYRYMTPAFNHLNLPGSQYHPSLCCFSTSMGLTPLLGS